VCTVAIYTDSGVNIGYVYVVLGDAQLLGVAGAVRTYVRVQTVGLQLLTVTHVVVFATVSCSTSEIVPS
jgi:hypothetical protein